MDGNSKREEDTSKTPSLYFEDYDTTGKAEDVLTLIWRTKYACEDAKQEKDAEKKSHWGFFTWFIIMYVSYRLGPTVPPPAGKAVLTSE
jgi:hypothetical protein